MKKRTIAMFLSVALCLSVALTGCGADKSQQSNPSDDGKKSLTIAVLNDVVSLDPAVKDSGIEMQMASHLYDALVDYNADLSRKPGLAESWTVLDDGVTWEFKLRHGVKFSNGNDFNADDVVFSFERILNDPTLEMGVYLMRLQEVKKVDDYTVQLVTKIPYPVFDGSLVHIMMLDKETCEGLTSEEIAANPVGTGRYRLVEHVKESYIKLVRNDEYWGELPDAETVEFRVIANTDGVDIDGFVMKPVGYEPGKRYPGILHIHGGPKMVFGPGFHHEMQLWAASGFFVCYCNPRGSCGKGNAFADLQGKYGEVDFRDLMEFTDEVLRRYPEIDADRMGVAGGSYGGFMTNWVIGHTDRFRCAVSQRSIANYVGDYLLSDIGYYYVPDQQLGTIWEHPERLWKASPLTYADRVKTPTLFIHADKDYRCTLANGLEMFAALKLHGVESKLCMFYGEDHGLSREGKPSNRISRLSEILRWVDEHLKGE